MTQLGAVRRYTSGQLGPKLQGLGKALPNKQFSLFALRPKVKMCKCQYTCPACRLVESLE